MYVILRSTAVAGLSLLLALTAAADYLKRVPTRSVYISIVWGHVIDFGTGTMTIDRDGSLTGSTAENGAFTGNWNWSDGYFCRDVAFDGGQTERGCMAVHAGGDTIVFTPNSGNGAKLEGVVK